MTDLTEQELKAELALLTALEDHKRFNKLLYFKPYPKQKLFLALGANKRVAHDVGQCFSVSQCIAWITSQKVGDRLL